MNFSQPTRWRFSLVWMKSSNEMSSAAHTSRNWRAMSSTYGFGSTPSSWARCETLMVFSSLPIWKWTEKPSMRRKRAWTSAPIFSKAVPMWGRPLG